MENFNLSIKKTITSIEIAEISNKQHKDVLEAIRKMEESWEKVTGRKFPLSEYKDSTGRVLPMYDLSKTECLYVATKFNDEARAKLVLRWEQLETKPLSDAEIMSRALLIAQQTLDNANKKVEILEQEIERVEPMKQAYMHLIDSKGEYDLSTIAKMFKIGRNKLCTLLRQKKIFMQGKTEPYQEYIKKGWFRVTTKEIKPKFFVSQSLVTNKGLSNLRPLILGEKMDAILVA